MAAEGQQHPIKVYVYIWLLLFVLSGFSYLVDYLEFQGHLRWFLIVVFMLLKAGYIVAIFMHMRWERPALVTAILVPPLVLLVLMYLLQYEAEYAWASRIDSFGADPMEQPLDPPTHAIH